MLGVSATAEAGDLQQAQHAKQAQQLQTSGHQSDAHTLEMAVADALTDRETPPTTLQQTSTRIDSFDPSTSINPTDSSTLVNPSDSSTLVNPREASASSDDQLSNMNSNDLDTSTSDLVSTKESDQSSETVINSVQNAASERQAVNELTDEVIGAQKQDSASLSESETKSPKSGFWNQPQIQRADLDSSSQASYSSRKSGMCESLQILFSTTQNYANVMFYASVLYASQRCTAAADCSSTCVVVSSLYGDFSL